MALAVESHSAKFELTISLTERKDGLQGWIEYSTDLFSEQSIRWLASRWERLLEQALCQPDVSVGNLSILHAEEQRLLTKWSGSDVAVCQSDRTLTRLFEQQVERTPAALAVISGEETWSYERLEQRANRLARLLQESGVGPEVPVGTLSEPGQCVSGGSTRGLEGRRGLSPRWIRRTRRAAWRLCWLTPGHSLCLRNAFYTINCLPGRHVDWS